MRDEEERMLGAVESGLFASNLGANMRGRPMTIDAIGDAEEKAPVPRGYQRATDLGASRFASLEPPRAHQRIRHLRRSMQRYRRRNKSLRHKSMCDRVSTAMGCRQQASRS